MNAKDKQKDGREVSELEAALREAEGELRALGDELGDVGAELGSVTAAIGVDLRGAAGETKRALRVAIAEARRAMRSAGERGADGGGSGAARMSRAERKELTRELLLDAAREVFATKGYHGASLEDVADAAGFTKGAVYSNFETKAALFVALAERELADRQVELTRALTQVPVHEMPTVARAWLDEQVRRRGEWDLLMLEFWLAAARDPELAAVLKSWQGSVNDDVGSLIEERLRAAGVEPAFSGSELMLLFDAIGTGLVMNALVDPDTEPGELFERATRMLASGRLD